MVRVTVPLPLPLAPFVTVIQLTCGVVVQVQPAAVVTVTLLVAPSAGTLLNVVDAQRQANRARLGAVDAQVALYQNIALLYVASAADWRQRAP